MNDHSRKTHNDYVTKLTRSVDKYQGNPFVTLRANTLHTQQVVLSCSAHMELFGCLHLGQWPMTYLMMLSDWTMSCQPWPPRARYGQ